MFHNMQKKAVSEDQGQKVKSADQGAKQQSINSSATPISTNQKEEKTMNAPQNKDNQPQNAGDNRVDIPGNNFNRPGQAPAAQGARPSYPGASYPGAAASTPAYSPQPANETDNGRKLVIGQGISLSGEIEACDHLIVEGTVEAALKGASNMDISEAGAFYGTVEIEEATIAGRFEGDITVNGRLTIQSTGVIIGSITYKELAIEAGATVEGSVTPQGSQGATARSGKKTSKAKTKVNQDNSAELPFSEKVAS